MNSQQIIRIAFFEKRILRFYRNHGREGLPWRKKDISAYEVWVSEIMLQQTQVPRVIEFYGRFLERFPDVFSLANVEWEEFLPFYRGLGYYRRGQNMLLTAKRVVEEFKGEFPRDIKSLVALPGIGEYTARAILSFAHADNHLAWDTNFQRVFGRFFFANKEALFEHGEFERRIVANKRDFNGAIMDFGSLVCVAKPKCEECPLVEKCDYFHNSGLAEQVEKREKKVRISGRSRAIVILHSGNRFFYSSDSRIYKPFILPWGIIARPDIKKYFSHTYGLEVSIRPAYRVRSLEGSTELLIRAQILLGDVAFPIFTKVDAGVIIKRLESS